MMKKEYIEELLERFMLGETSEQEETALAEYFATEKDVPEEWKGYAAMFEAFAAGEPCFTEEEKDAFCEKSRPERRLIAVLGWVSGVAAAVVALVVCLSPHLHTGRELPKPVISQAVDTVKSPDAPDVPDLILKEEKRVAVAKPKNIKEEKGNPVHRVNPVTEEPPITEEAVHYCRYDGDITAPRMHTDIQVREMMLECELALLEEEFQENDMKYRTVSL